MRSSCGQKRDGGRDLVPPIARSHRPPGPEGPRCWKPLHAPGGPAARCQAPGLSLPRVPTRPPDFLILPSPAARITLSPPSPTPSAPSHQARFPDPHLGGKQAPSQASTGCVTATTGCSGGVRTGGLPEEGCSLPRSSTPALPWAGFRVETKSQASQGLRLFPGGVWGQTGLPLARINWTYWQCGEGSSWERPPPVKSHGCHLLWRERVD